MTRLSRQFFTGRPTPAIARDLLGKRLVYDNDHEQLTGLIVEAEAYCGTDDVASHAYGGRHTVYTVSLFKAPGTWYLYQIRGWICCDIVTQKTGEPQSVLLRAIQPLQGQDLMAQNRHQQGTNISNGPAKLMQALGIEDRQLDGMPIGQSPLWIDDQHARIPARVNTTSRVGTTPRGPHADEKWRFFVAGNPYVSGMRKREVDQGTLGWR